ncbi:TCR/Tet family MFS transporter [Reyranella sp.]|uniref:TCR/Tet family MFS transporter n=1 Tax=Reyranella sp. TaxID=1929291 RepID=UPI003D12DDCF
MTSRRAIAFIFCTVTLDVLALGLMIPVLPRIVLGFMGGDTAGAAEMFGAFATVWALMQFFFSPLLGVVSDRYGRRPVILISCLGLGLDYIFMAVAPTLTLLFVGRVISGITSATIGTSFAYIADVTPANERARAFGLVGMAFGLGFVVGPAIGGLLGSLDPRLPLWAAAAACLINAGFGWFVLPESLPPEKRMAFTWKRANPVGSFRLLAAHRELLGLAAVNFLGQLAHQVLPAIFVLYAAYRYGWGETNVGLTLAFVGVCSAVVQGALVGPVVARLGERATLLLGLLCGALGMAIYGLAPTGLLFLAGVPTMALWGLSGPAIMGLMSRLVSPSEQGQLQGANTSLASVAGLIGPGIFAVTFSGLLDRRPGAAFDLAALILLGALAVAWTVTRRRPACAPPL